MCKRILCANVVKMFIDNEKIYKQKYKQKYEQKYKNNNVYITICFF